MKKFTLIPLFIFLVSCSIFAQNGLKAAYYDGVNFDRLVGTQIERNIDYYWNDDAPFKNMNPNECSVRWTGRLMSPKTGEFTFSARVDDGIRVWVGGALVIDNWQLNDIGYSRGHFKMKEGEYYDIKIEYFNALNEAEIKLSWILPKPTDLGWYDNFWYKDKEEIVPSRYFFQPKEEKIAEIKKEKEEKIIPPKPKKKKATTPVQSQTTPASSPQEIAIEHYIPKNVQFEQAKAEILPESFPELNRLAEFLIRNTHHKIKIEGHTDNVGDAKMNVQLSHSRARAVAAYLIKKGVSHQRLSAEGFGGSRPLSKPDGREYHPENRRVEFIVE